MSNYLSGQILIAAPQMDDPRFHNTVLLICRHDASSAMGFILNKQAEGLSLNDLAEQVGLGTPRFCGDTPVHYGGPVETSRGMVLHSPDHVLPESEMVGDVAAITTNVRIISEIANGCGPNDFIIALGHAGWSAGQLEQELKGSCWITMPYVEDLVFGCLSDNLWSDCYNRLGIATEHISSSVGHA